METIEDGDSPTHDHAECISQLLNFSRSNWNDKNNLENIRTEFIEFYGEDINNGFSRVEHRTLIDSLSVFPIDILRCLRSELGNQLLAKYGLGSTLILKVKRTVNTISNDIYFLTHNLCNNELTEENFLILFNKQPTSQTLFNNSFSNEDVEDLFIAVEEIKAETSESNKNYMALQNSLLELNQLSKKQSEQINNLIVDNRTLHEAVKSNHVVIQSLEKLIKNFIEMQSKQTITVPQITQSKVVSYADATPTETQNIQKPQAPTTPASRKRPTNDVNHADSNKNKIQKKIDSSTMVPTTATNNETNRQKSLKNFNSYEPGKPNIDIEDDTLGYKVAGPKRKTNKKTSTTTNMKNAGIGDTSGLNACVRKIEVYLGRIDNGEKSENVKKYVESIVRIYSFTEIKTAHNNFKSFKFSISIFDKEIINQKDSWPKGSVVNKYRRPYAERQTNTEKNEQNRSQNLTTANNTTNLV